MRHGIRFWTVLVAVVALVAGGSSALADHVFPDSTDDQAFHQQVEHIAGAGCATGFDDGTFRPNQSITRQQFAAWMNRCGGRTTHTVGGGTDLTVSGQFSDVGGFSRITSGATGSLAIGGFVHVTASVTARVQDPGDLNCPCFVNVRLEDRTDGDIGAAAASTMVANPDAGRDGAVSVPLTGTFEIGPDETKDFGVEAAFFDTNVGTITFSVQMNAVYVPFGPEGDNTMVFEGS